MSWIGVIGSTSGTWIRSVGMMCADGDRRARHAGAAQRGLQNGLLLQHARLRDHQRCSRGSDLRLGAHHFDLRQGAHFHLLAVVLQQLLRRGQRVARHLHGLVERHQIPVQLHDRRHRGLHLELESEVADLPVVSARCGSAAS